jgi:hypothetical protein
VGEHAAVAGPGSPRIQGATTAERTAIHMLTVIDPPIRPLLPSEPQQ